MPAVLQSVQTTGPNFVHVPHVKWHSSSNKATPLNTLPKVSQQSWSRLSKIWPCRTHSYQTTVNLSMCQVSIIMKVVCNVFTGTRPWKTALYADRPHRFIYNPATYVVYSVSICFAFSLIGVLFFIIFTKVFLLPIMDFHTKGLHPLSRLNIFR